MKQIIRLTESDLYNIIKESVNTILIEAKGIKSKKLYNIIKQHGGVKSNRGIFDLHNMTDDDIIDVVDWNGIRNFNYHPNDLDIADEIDYIELKDGKYIIAKCRGGRFDRVSKNYNNNREKMEGDFEDLVSKTSVRRKNRYHRKDDFVCNNEKAYDLWNNPWFRDKSEGWVDPQRRREKLNQAKNK